MNAAASTMRPPAEWLHLVTSYHRAKWGELYEAAAAAAADPRGRGLGWIYGKVALAYRQLRRESRRDRHLRGGTVRSGRARGGGKAVAARTLNTGAAPRVEAPSLPERVALSLPEDLSDRELLFCRLLASGLTNPQASAICGRSAAWGLLAIRSLRERLQETLP